MANVARQRVLVVDDEPQVLVALEDLLSDKFIVLKTESAEDALRVMDRERDIAVVITDQRMPKMNGDELLARLGGSSDAQRILLTGYADLSAVVRAVNDGKIFAYVEKPWNAQDLELTVQTAADHFRLAKELAHERRLLRDLMDNIPDRIYFKDLDLGVLRANRSFALGVDAADGGRIAGSREDAIPALADTEATESEDRRILSDGKPVLDVVREYQWNGATHWLSESKAPIRGPDGGVVGLVGISRDVTDRIRGQQALRESEERLHKQTRILNSILDSMGEGVIAAGQAGEVLLFNRRAQQILGAPLLGALPVDWMKAHGVCQGDGKTPIPPEQDPLLLAMKGEATPETEVCVRSKSGASARIAITATSLLDDENQLTGGMALLRDVTQQRGLEQQLVQSQKMDAIGRLAGGVAHDFNNLLAVILSCAELVRMGLAAENPAREDLAELIAAAHRAAGLTRQLLAFSRRQVVQPKTLLMNDVVSNVEKMLRRVIGEDIDFATKLRPALGMIRADAGQLEQIILNLTVNARDAMPEGGRLTIETANVTLTEDYARAHSDVTPGEFVMLAVTDTGTGLDTETRRRIFEPFFTTKEVGKGTGLGLSTVYGIVQQNGGHIWVYSERQRGTSFKIYFPRVDGAPTMASERRSSFPAPPAGTGTILLVEDDEAVRRVALRILRDSGYAVLEARRAADARRICEERGPTIDLVVTDVVMPGISGPKLAEELIGLHPQMRVVYMSGYPGGAVAREGLLDGGVPYVEKPFSPRSLAEKVREALRTVH